MLPPLAINGKFLSAAPTGVHRVAAELVNALLALGQEGVVSLDIELWLPRDAMANAAAIDLPPRLIKPFTGIPWEQVTIARYQPKRLLLNLCNIAAPLRSNAVTMIHDAQVYLTPASYRTGFRLWYKMVQPLVARRQRQILTVSNYSKTEIARAGICPPNRISVIYNGVDHVLQTAGDPRIFSRFVFPERYVVALASTQIHKNIGLLANAFRDRALADIGLVLVGADDRTVFASHGMVMPERAVLTGRVSDGELRALYERALCVAFPSLTEGFGLPPLEAMLLGCPAVVAPCGAVPEVCGDAAVFAGPHEPQEWVQAIRRLADDPAHRAEMAARGMARARLFTWRTAALRLVDVLENLRENR